MRTLIAIAVAAVLLVPPLARTQRALAQAPDESNDPVYHVELIVFAYTAGDRSEEDLFHGQEDRIRGPRPELFRLPAIELETLADYVPFAERTAASEEAVPEPVLEAGAPSAEASNGDPSEVIAQSIDSGFDPTTIGNEPEPLTDALELFELDDASAGSDTGLLPAEFRALTQDELELVNEARRLDRLGAYDVLAHVGWVQTGVDTDRSIPVDLKRLGVTNPAGTVEVYLRRFLHAAVDLEFSDGRGTQWSLPPGFGLRPFEYAETYTIRDEANAMRLEELHGIDHPLFGLLIRVTRAPEPDPETVDPASGRPAG